MICADVRKFAYVYLDGEFTAEEASELEKHMEACPSCAASIESDRRFHRELRHSLAEPNPELPAELMSRIDRALHNAARDEGSTVRRKTWLGLGAASVALAAGLVLVVGHLRSETRDAVLVESLVDSHQRNLPVEVASGDPENVKTWFEGKVDVPVTPPRPKRPNTRLLGGRISHVHERDAAQLVYDVSGRKVSVLIFDPRGLEIDGRRRTRVRNREVLLDGRRGFNVALFRDRGLGYAVTAEANDQELIDFVNASFAP